MTGRNQFKRYKPIITLIIFIFKLFGQRINNILLSLFRNTNGKLGLFLRYVFVKNLAKELGDNVSIHPNIFLFNLQNITIGSNVSIHPMCYIEGAGGIQIGNDVSIAHNTSLISTNHTWDDQDISIKYNPETYSKILIEEDVWIGCGVRILAGVRVYSRTVVAAGAVVSKSCDGSSIIGGVPAKVIKRINEN